MVFSSFGLMVWGFSFSFHLKELCVSLNSLLFNTLFVSLVSKLILHWIEVKKLHEKRLKDNDCDKRNAEWIEGLKLPPSRLRKRQGKAFSLDEAMDFPFWILFHFFFQTENWMNLPHCLFLYSFFLITLRKCR